MGDVEIAFTVKWVQIHVVVLLALVEPDAHGAHIALLLRHYEIAHLDLLDMHRQVKAYKFASLPSHTLCASTII